MLSMSVKKMTLGQFRFFFFQFCKKLWFSVWFWFHKINCSFCFIGSVFCTACCL